MEKDNAPPYEPPQPDAISSPEPPLHKEDIVVIKTQPEVFILGPDASAVSCPFCHAPIVTTVKTEPSTKTHILAAILCCLGGLLCVWIPYCTKSCQSQTHYCPNCKAYLGKYEK